MRPVLLLISIIVVVGVRAGSELSSSPLRWAMEKSLAEDSDVLVQAKFNFGNFLGDAANAVGTLHTHVAKVGDVLNGIKSIFGRKRERGGGAGEGPEDHPLVGLVGAISCAPTNTGSGLLRASWSWLGNVGQGQDTTTAAHTTCAQQQEDDGEDADDAEEEDIEGMEEDDREQRLAIMDFARRLAEAHGHPRRFDALDRKAQQAELLLMREEEKAERERRALERRMELEAAREEELERKAEKLASKKGDEEMSAEKLREERDKLEDERREFEAEKRAWQADKCGTGRDIEYKDAERAVDSTLVDSEDQMEHSLDLPHVSIEKQEEESGYKLDPSDAMQPPAGSKHSAAIKALSEAAVDDMRRAFSAKLLEQEKEDVDKYRHKMKKEHLKRLENDVAWNHSEEKAIKHFAKVVSRVKKMDPSLASLDSIFLKPIVPAHVEGTCTVGFWSNIFHLVQEGKILAKRDHFDPAGHGDGASAYENIRDAAVGKEARRSTHSHAPGGSTCLDPKLAEVILHVARLGEVTINSIAGGSHKWAVNHYEGQAVDFGSLNGGVLDESNADTKAVVDACRAHGAIEVYASIIKDCEECKRYTEWTHCAV